MSDKKILVTRSSMPSIEEYIEEYLERICNKKELSLILIEFLKKDYQVFIFCPTIDECEELYKIIKPFIKGKGAFVHSKNKDREEIISKFKKGEYRYLVTTSVLERGVTVKNIQVIVVSADSPIYTDGTLVQIAGRVGRKLDAFDGEIIFLCDKEEENVIEAIRKINEANEYVDL